MKRTFTISILAAVLAITATTASARSWRINNNATQKAKFTDLNAAMNSDDVQAGDTLYLDPGCNLTATQTVTKRVTIVGSGYFRTNAPHLFATISGKLYLNAQDIKVEGVIMTNNTYLCHNYITLERCKTSTIYINENWSQHEAQHATIQQCYIANVCGGSNGSSLNKTAFATIENCIIRYDGNDPTVKNLYSPTIRNCYIAYTGTSDYWHVLYELDNATIKNNILINTSVNTRIFDKFTNSIVSNNVISCAEDTYAAYTSNNKFLNSTDESLVFALEGTNDQKYQLKEDSPAKNYADDRGDCGPFGGGNPYVINGLPTGYPYYTNAVIGTRSKDGKINVSLNIKMQNE